jgi:hypothetical protein
MAKSFACTVNGSLKSSGAERTLYNASMSLRVSRRRWVFLMGATAPLLAQSTAQTPPVVSTPEQRLDKAKADVREVSDKLAAITVPMAIEPSFKFVA